MITYASQDFDEMEKTFRVNFINSLSGFKSSNLIGTADGEGNLNLAIFSSVVHLGADPALIGLVTRPRTVERHSIENIIGTGYYTINHVNRDILEAAHQTSARYPKEQSEFDAVGLTPAWIDDFPAPMVEESRLTILMKFVESKPIDINNTEFVIGEIQKVILKDRVVKDDGYIDIEALDTIAASGLDSYHVTNRVGRLSYAKPQKKPDWLKS